MLVEISGTGFTAKTRVRFGEEPAKEITYLTPTVLLARNPSHAEGAVDVSAQDEAGPGQGPAAAFTYKSCVGQQAILLLVLLAGALGGTLSSIRSLYWYVGNRDLKWSWVPMYAFRPLTGTALACIFFLCVNGGLVTSQNPSNRLWIIGLSALVGLFSSQGYEKLKKIFEAIFTEVPPAADKPAPASGVSGVTVLAVNPANGPIAGGGTVTITGTGFAPSTTVRFGTAASPRVVVNNPASLSVDVPAAANAGPVDVAVTVPGSPAVTLQQGFTYT